jgi:hypothetical protein
MSENENGEYHHGEYELTDQRRADLKQRLLQLQRAEAEYFELKKNSSIHLRKFDIEKEVSDEILNIFEQADEVLTDLFGTLEWVEAEEDFDKRLTEIKLPDLQQIDAGFKSLYRNVRNIQGKQHGDNDGLILAMIGNKVQGLGLSVAIALKKKMANE